MGLDIYLLRKVYIGAGCGSRWLKIEGTVDIRKNGKNIPVELNRIWEITECVGYWRKFAPLHQLMLENTLSDKNDCLEHVISQEVISKLKADCEKIVSAEKDWVIPAKEVFPYLHFEKADPDQLEEFFSEIIYTYQILLNLPEEYPDAVYCYKASW